MKFFLLLVVALVAEVSFGSVDMTGSFSIHADVETLTALISVLGGVTTLVKCWPSHNRE